MKAALWETGLVDRQKTQLNIEKHYSGMMILIIELMRSINCGQTGHTGNRRRYQEKELEEAKRTVF